MPFAPLSRLAQEAPLRLLLINLGDELSVTLAGLVQPLRLAARLLGPARLQLSLMTPEQLLQADAPAQQFGHISLLVADDEIVPLSAEQGRMLIARCQNASYWGAVGSAVLWLARTGAMDAYRTALPWALYAEAGDIAERTILTPNLFEIDRNRLSCCGGAASIDF